MQQKEKDVFFENLDALRGIAFGMVFIFHFFCYIHYQPVTYLEEFFVTNLVMQGFLGVNLFFVLSGFLITYLLLVEKERSGKINIPFFYMRRVLRIWPLFFLVLFLGFFIFPKVIGQFSMDTVKQHLCYYLLFLVNFDRISTGFVGVGNDNLGVLWSVAIEEQFYLFWPLLLALLNKKYYLCLFYFIIVASLVFRWLNVHSETLLYLHSFSVMSDLAIGGLLAYSCIYKTKLFHYLQNCKRSFIVGMYVLLFFTILTYHSWSDHNVLTLVSKRLILSILFAFAIGEQCFADNSFFKLGKLKALGRIGIISYGLYCLHIYSLSVIQKFNTYLHYIEVPKIVFFTELFAALGLSIGCCYLSYTLFEKKVLRLKTRFTTITTRFN